MAQVRWLLAQRTLPFCIQAQAVRNGFRPTR
jgi:hypothetical protein